MAELLFPRRSRCANCRKELGATVLLGKYCSWQCTGTLSRPADTPDRAPRGCRAQREGRWVFKQRYRHEGEAPQALRTEAGMSSYWCTEAGGCGRLHFGRTLVRLEGTANRGLRDRAAMADLLAKARGRATHKQVAATTGVRMVRIKEWEDPGFATPSLEALWPLLRAYRIDLVAVLR